ncbi:MAG: hypothetical protein VXY93_21585, partial [Pseudomonadota bacterium]|nr:hypothetical protein [Pseudomonadota bacterium]
TARSGINVSGGEIIIGSNIKIGNAGIITASSLDISGDITASSLDISGDIDVDGHTNLDNTNIVGVATVSSRLNINHLTYAGLSVAANDRPWRGQFMVKDLDTGNTSSPYMTFWNGNEDSSVENNTGLEGRVGLVNAGASNERFDVWSYRTGTPLSFATQGTERLRITSGGRVVIG